jgi:hypothetical protein
MQVKSEIILLHRMRAKVLVMLYAYKSGQLKQRSRKVFDKSIGKHLKVEEIGKLAVKNKFVEMVMALALRHNISHTEVVNFIQQTIESTIKLRLERDSYIKKIEAMSPKELAEMNDTLAMLREMLSGKQSEIVEELNDQVQHNALVKVTKKKGKSLA